MPVWFYDWANAVRFSEHVHGHIVKAIRARLAAERSR